MLENLFSPRFEFKNKFNIDTTEIALKLLSVIDCTPKQYEIEFEKFVQFLEQNLNRKVSDHEQLSLAKSILDYIKSEPETTERSTSMKTIFCLEFLEVPKQPIND